MKFHSLVFGCLLAVLAAGVPVTAQQGPEGLWAGQLARDGSVLAVEMTFSHSASGYEGSFSSSQLRVTGIPLARVSYAAPALSWEIVGDQTTKAFKGTLSGNLLSGTFREGKASGTFTLTRSTATEAPAREEEVTFADGPVTLSGTVISPAGAGPFPGIVFLHGPGAEGRWASGYLAREFARHGVAALIYDKRGVGRSTGDWRTAGFAELVHDASAAVEALRSRPQVSQGEVGIYGHSEGGTIAPWVASENRHVAFVVGAASCGVSMAEMETYRIGNAMNIRALPAGEEPLAEYYVSVLVDTAYEGGSRSELDAAWERVRDRPWAVAPPPASDYYWSFSRAIASYDPLSFWRRVTVPVLLLYGEEDARVPARRSAARIAESYLGANGPRLDVIFFPIADHNFYLPQDAAGKFAWPRSVPGFPDCMIEWVQQVTRP